MADYNLNPTEQGIYDSLGADEEPDVSTEAPDANAPTDAPPSDTPAPTPSDGTQPPASGGSPADGGPQPQHADDQRFDRASRSDAQGNLVDARGNVIARAGGERRLYERGLAQQRYIQQLEGKMRDFESRSEQHNVFSSLPEKKGITLSDAELGMDIMANFKRDPLSVARWALQETQALGYTVEQITDAKGGTAVTPQIIEQIIDRKLGQRAPAQGDATAQQTKVQEQYNAFVAHHENAEMHGDEIATIMQGKGVSADVAYWQLKEYVARNGYDWNQPLRPQWDAKQRAPQGQPQQPNGQAQPASAPNVAPMPNGGGLPSSMQQEAQFASPDDTWDTIVASSLRNAGFS